MHPRRCSPAPTRRCIGRSARAGIPCCAGLPLPHRPPAPAAARQAFRLVRGVQRASVVLLCELGARLLRRRPRLCDVRACRRLRAGRGAERLHRDLRFRDGRCRLGAARDRLELRQRAHDLLPRLIQTRLQILDLRVPLGDEQPETRHSLLEDRIMDRRTPRRCWPGGGAVFGHLWRHGCRLEQTRCERRRYTGIKEGATKEAAHPAASCESACSCCIGSWAWALTPTPGCGIVTTKPSLTRSGRAW